MIDRISFLINGTLYSISFFISYIFIVSNRKYLFFIGIIFLLLTIIGIFMFIKDILNKRYI